MCDGSSSLHILCTMLCHSRVRTFVIPLTACMPEEPRIVGIQRPGVSFPAYGFLVGTTSPPFFAAGMWFFGTSCRDPQHDCWPEVDSLQSLAVLFLKVILVDFGYSIMCRYYQNSVRSCCSSVSLMLRIYLFPRCSVGFAKEARVVTLIVALTPCLTAL